MNFDEIKEYLVDFQQKPFPFLVDRELKLPDTHKIITIIGPRRSGKSYRLYQLMTDLIESGVSKENIIRLDFESPKLSDVRFTEVHEIIKLQWQLYPNSVQKQMFVFVDEPQTMDNWEKAVRALNEEGFRVFVTGSSSKLLSQEIATALRGRTLSYLLLPFSFKEFLTLKQFEGDLHKLSSKEKSVLMSLMDEYLEWGGYPEIALENTNELKLKTISEYYDLVIFKDIVERFKIKNTKVIKWLIKSAITSCSKEFSIHKIYSTLKSQGIKVSKNTLYEYTSLMEDVLFSFFLPKFKHSERKKELSINKLYLCDIAFSKLTENSNGKGKKMENTVFLELKRRAAPITQISYWKNIQQEEVDFVIQEGPKLKQLIQVSQNISEFETKKREIRALLKASTELKCSNLLMITENAEATEKIKGKTIQYVPLWKWLLNN